MFGKNLKYYRLKNNMSMKELAKALNVRVTDFLAYRDADLVFCHGEFKKSSSMSAKQQEFVKEEVEEYFGRFFQVVAILGGEVLPIHPKLHSLELSDSPEDNASKMRECLGLSKNDPVGGLIENLENKGFLVYLCDIKNEDFAGMNGTVNGRPYIILNKNMNPQRMRLTIAHELAHLMFEWPDSMSEKELENMANAISGAFLFPHIDIRRELGVRRSAITNDMLDICAEYGISMYMLVMRANMSGVINDYTTKNFVVSANKAGWKRYEPPRAKEEECGLFHQLVYRAVTENEITAQKGAELLREPYEKVVKACSVMEVVNGIL